MERKRERERERERERGGLTRVRKKKGDIKVVKAVVKRDRETRRERQCALIDTCVCIEKSPSSKIRTSTLKRNEAYHMKITAPFYINFEFGNLNIYLVFATPKKLQ